VAGRGGHGAMNLGNVRLVLRERENLDLLDLALRFVSGADRRAFLVTSLAFLAPALAGLAALHFALGLAWPALWLVALAIGPVLEGPFTMLAGRLVFGDPAPLGVVARGFGARLGAFVAGLVLQGAALALGSLLVLAWVIPWVRTAYLPEACLLERASGPRAFARSIALVRGAAARTLGLVMLLALAQAAGVLVGELVGQALAHEVLQLSLPFGSLFTEGGSLWALAGYLAARPYIATARFLAYVDRRTRLDGWELQVRVMSLTGEQAEVSG